MSCDTAVKVCCRLRPINKVEQQSGGKCCIKHDKTSLDLYDEEFTGFEPHKFSFDAIFGPETSQ